MISNAIKLQPAFESCGLITHLTRYILHCNLIHMLQLPARPRYQLSANFFKKKTTAWIILELFLPKIKYTKEWTDLQASTTTNRLQIHFAARRRLMAICHALQILQIKLVMDGWMEGWMNWGCILEYIYMYTPYHILKNLAKTTPKSKSHEFGCINPLPHDISKDTALWWCWWPCIGTPAAYGALRLNGGQHNETQIYSNTTPSPK